MSTTSAARGPLATTVAVLVVGLVVGLGMPRVVGPAPPPAPVPTPVPTAEPTPRVETPDPGDGPVATPTPEPTDPPLPAEEQRLLRERLGGLASLVLTDDALVEACAAPGVVADERSSAAAAAQDVAGGHRVADVTTDTEALRGLELTEPVDVRTLSADELAAEVEERFSGRGDPDRVARERRVLSALGAIEPDTDLAELRLGAFAEQVSGVHAGTEGLVLLRVDDPPALDPLERVVLAHELEHALSYQHLGRPAEHRAGAEDADSRRASAAVVEGSATLLMLQYARTVLEGPERGVLHDLLLERAEEGGLVDYTPYLLAELRFPYNDGLRFACSVWLDDGWAAVDATYTRPPSTTAEILFPERYGEEPARPAAPGRLGEPWERLRSTTFGAAELRWLIEAPGGAVSAALDSPRERAGAWDGGRIDVWGSDGDTAVGISLVERDDGVDRPALCDTVHEWYAAAFPAAEAATREDATAFEGPQQDAVVTCAGAAVRLGIAPTVEVAAELVAD